MLSSNVTLNLISRNHLMIVASNTRAHARITITLNTKNKEEVDSTEEGDGEDAKRRKMTDCVMCMNECVCVCLWPCFQFYTSSNLFAERNVLNMYVSTVKMK